MISTTRGVQGILRLIAVLATAIGLFSCGIWIRPDLDVPSGVTASQDRSDLIELTWNAVAGAEVYYVYRSLSESGPFGTSGTYGLIPYRSVTQPTLLDTDVDPTNYYYSISAGRLSTGEESGLSAAVLGALATEDVEWLPESTIFVDPGSIRVAIDYTTPTVAAYLLTVNEAAGSQVSVNQFDEEGTLTDLGAPVETVDGRVPRSADIAAAGSLYLALVAENPVVGSDTDKVFLFRYDNDAEEWLYLEGSALAVAHETNPYLTLIALDEDDVLVAYRGSAGEMQAYRYDGSLNTASVPATTDDTPNNAVDSVGWIDGRSYGGSAVLLYELEDDDLITPGDTTRVQTAMWTTGPDAWIDSLTPAYDGSGGNVADGAASVTYDPSVFPPEDGITVGYVISSGITLTDTEGAALPGSSTGFTGTPETASPALAVAAQSGVISVFYRDSVLEEGVVTEFDPGPQLWTVASPAEFTSGADPGLFTLRGGGGQSFAAWQSGGLARYRSFQ